MDLLETAKDILKKGTELNDPELIAMGHAMIEKYSNEVVDEVESNKYNYVCSNCQEKFSFDKTRKKCPNCKKHTLKLHDNIKPVTSTSRRLHGRKSKINTTKRINKFVDDGTMFINDPEDLALRKFPVTPRRGPRSELMEVKCIQCGKTRQVSSVLIRSRESAGAAPGYRCDRCIAGR